MHPHVFSTLAKVIHEERLRKARDTMLARQILQQRKREIPPPPPTTPAEPAPLPSVPKDDSRDRAATSTREQSRIPPPDRAA